MGAQGAYYIPQPSHWPLMGSIGLSSTLAGAAFWLHDEWYGPYVFTLGFCVLIGMFFGWFGQVIYENQRGRYNLHVDKSFRWGMCWFIFSEVCFFGGFFGALFLSRYFTVPELGGEMNPSTHLFLWPQFKAAWPLLVNPDNREFVGAHEAMGAWGLAAINTVIFVVFRGYHHLGALGITI